MNELKAGAILNYVSICLNMIVGLIYTPYMLRMLGQSEYGLYSLAASIIANLTVLDLGFGNAIVRYTAKFRAEGKQRVQEEMFGMFFVLYIGIGVIAMIVGSVLSLNVENLFSQSMTETEVSRTRIMLWLMTFNLAFTFPMSIWGSIMTAYERFVFQRVVSVIRSVLNPIVMVLLLVVGHKAVSMVVVTTIFNVATLLINWWYCKYKLSIKIRFARFKFGLLKEVSVYSFWIFLQMIMDRIYWSTGQFILGIYSGAVAIAVYAVAIQLQNMYMLFSTAISGVMLPKITAIVAKGNDEREVSDLFIKVGRIQFIVVSFILSAFVVLGKFFIQLWAGVDYLPAYYICLLFFIPFTIDLIQNIGISILQARNQLKFRSVLLVIVALCSMLLSVVLVTRYGYYGCAFSTGLGLLFGQGLVLNVYYYYKQHLDIIRFWKEIFKMSVAPICVVTMSLICFHSLNLKDVSFYGFSAIALVFSSVYIIIFWLFSMNANEKLLIMKPFKAIIKY